MVDDRESLKKEIERMQKQLEKLTVKLESLVSVREIGRVRTFVRGFDEKIGGGIPKSHIALLAGPSGTMKSSLALSILSRNIQEGANGVYLTLEETKSSLMTTAADLGLEIGEDSIVDVGEMRRAEEIADDAGNWFDIITTFLTKTKKKRKISIMVLDCLDSVFALSNRYSLRDEASKFFHSLRDLGLTALIISEAEGPAKFPNHEDRLADGVISLGREFGHKEGVRLTIGCYKMRHTKHSRDYYVLDFDNGEFFISETPT